MKLPDSLNKLLQSVAILIATLCMSSCDPILDNGYDEEDCVVTYHIRFKYDYNMLFVDAFAQQVTSLHLFAFDDEGRLVHQKSDQGTALAQQGYAMQVEWNPADYTLVVWGGLAGNATFSVPQNITTIDQLICTMQRVNAQVGELTPLFHSRVKNPQLTIENNDELNPVVLVPLMKNTNTLRVVLQNLAEKPLNTEDFTFTITDENGRMNYDNSLLPDEMLTYTPFYLGQGSVDYQQSASTSSRNSEQLNVVIAEFTFGRLMADRKPMLTVTNNRTGDTVLSLPLTDYLALVKSHYKEGMSDQEYFDRQDEYSLTFFLDENSNWYSAVILVNSWRIVRSEVDV